MKINVAVFFGGKTVEHEISVISALQAMSHIREEKYGIFPVYISKEGELYTGAALRDIEQFRDIPALLKQCTKVHFVTQGSKTFLTPNVQKLFGKQSRTLIDVGLPVVHGTNVEDGALQGFLRTLNLPFVGCDVLSSAVCMDKYASKILLKEAGFPVLPCLRFSRNMASTAPVAIEAAFPYPVIVKPVNLGSSVGITKANDRLGLERALENAFTFAPRVIVEPAVTPMKEINCSVLGDSESARASECEEPVGGEDILSYSDKYMSGGSKKTGDSGSKGMASLKRKIPADISADVKADIQRIAVEAFQSLDCAGVARIDFLMNAETGEYWINEFNTIPGSLSFYLWEATGLPYADLLEQLISIALKRARQEEDSVRSFDTNILASGTSFGSKGAKGAKG